MPLVLSLFFSFALLSSARPPGFLMLPPIAVSLLHLQDYNYGKTRVQQDEYNKIKVCNPK
jgi:hypothetical protein